MSARADVRWLHEWKRPPVSWQTYAAGCSEAEWQTVCPSEQRSVGVLVHHVANMYPIEVQLVQDAGVGKADRRSELGRC